MSNIDTKDAIRAVLGFDPIDEAEKAAGASIDHIPGAGMFLFAAKEMALRTLMEQTGDTHHKTAFDQYCDIAQTAGFSAVLEETFVSSEGKTESYIVMWHPDGFLLRLESYTCSDRRSVNTAEIYYNIRFTREQRDSGAGQQGRQSGGWALWDDYKNEYVWFGHHDVRQCLLHHLSEVRAAGTVMPEWFHHDHLWLVTYEETHYGDPRYGSGTEERSFTERSNYFAACTDARIARFPSDLSDMVQKALAQERVFNEIREHQS